MSVSDGFKSVEEERDHWHKMVKAIAKYCQELESHLLVAEATRCHRDALVHSIKQTEQKARRAQNKPERFLPR